MPIRLAQARLIPQDSRDPRPDHRTGIRTPLGPPDTLQMAGAGRLIREKMLKLQQNPRVIRHAQEHTPMYQPVLTG